MNIPAVPVAAVDRADLGHPAADPSPSACGDENDTAIGKIFRFVIVERSRSDLPDVGAVDVNFVEIVISPAGFSPGKKYFLRIVVDFRIADTTFGRFQQDRNLAGF